MLLTNFLTEFVYCILNCYAHMNILQMEYAHHKCKLLLLFIIMPKFVTPGFFFGGGGLVPFKIEIGSNQANFFVIETVNLLYMKRECSCSVPSNVIPD